MRRAPAVTPAGIVNILRSLSDAIEAAAVTEKVSRRKVFFTQVASMVHDIADKIEADASALGLE